MQASALAFTALMCVNLLYYLPIYLLIALFLLPIHLPLFFFFYLLHIFRMRAFLDQIGCVVGGIGTMLTDTDRERNVTVFANIT